MARKGQFQKGQSGNPKGRPKSESFREAVLKKKYLDNLFWKALEYNLKQHNPKVVMWYGDQRFGKSPQPIIGPDGEKLDGIEVLIVKK